MLLLMMFVTVMMNKFPTLIIWPFRAGGGAAAGTRLDFNLCIAEESVGDSSVYIIKKSIHNISRVGYTNGKRRQQKRFPRQNGA